MISVKIKSRLIRLINYQINFFFDRPQQRDLVKLVEYNYCKSRSDFFGFKREICFTKIIDLSPKKEEILAKFRGNTRNEINKAIRIGITINLEENLEQFVNFYSLFAKSKRRRLISLEYLKSLGDNLIILKASYGSNDLAMYSYLIDRETKRVRTMAGGTLFRYETDPDKIKLFSMANRFLYFAAMLFFKGRNFQIFDLGGYDYEHKDEECVAINKFKDSFRGDLLEESIYTSYPLFAYQFLADNFYNLINKPSSKVL